MSGGRRILRLTFEKLHQLLDLKPSLKIRGVDCDFDTNVIKVYIEDPNAPEVPEGYESLWLTREQLNGE